MNYFFTFKLKIKEKLFLQSKTMAHSDSFEQSQNMIQDFDPSIHPMSQQLPYTQERVKEYNSAIKRCSSLEMVEYAKQLFSSMSGQINAVTLVSGSFIDTHDVFDPSFTRSHEFPMFVQDLFWRPQSRICKDFLNKLLPYVEDKTQVMVHPRYITTEQVLILCDPCYTTKRFEPIQLIYKLLISNSILLNVRDQCFGTTSKYITSEGELVYVHSILKVIVIPEDINYNFIKYIEELKYTQSHNKYVLNVLDCTSRFTQKDFVEKLHSPDSDGGIFYTESKCFLEDSLDENLPVIIENGRFITSRHECILHFCETEQELNMDKCHTFLNASFIKKTLHIDLLGIYKLWCFFYMDRQYTSRNPNTLNSVFNTRDMDYVEFRHLISEPGFKSLLISCVGTYYPNELIFATKNIDTTIRNNPELQRDGQRSMINVCKYHACHLLHELQVHCPQFSIPFYEEEKIDRTFLAELLTRNNIYL